MKSIVYEVDNRVFLLGLEGLYRAAMKRHERGELLDCARRLCANLTLSPPAVPVEGYYFEDERLTEYFTRMRALRTLPAAQAGDISDTNAFERLKAVTSSRLFGRIAAGDYLLPAGVDPLSDALETAIPDWSIEALVADAHEIAQSGDDYSLVALAALARDPVVLTALRESVVLYAAVVAAGLPPKDPKYLWKVDDVIATRAVKFVDTFNELFGEAIPQPSEHNAKLFFDAANVWSIEGRCVRLGFDDRTTPIRHYHWAIRSEHGQLAVEDFWDTRHWTTDRYMADRYPGRFPKAPQDA